MEDKPFKSLDITAITEGDTSVSPIPRRKKATSNPGEPNGVQSNGSGIEVTNGGASNGNPVKRTASDAIQDGSPLSKRPKTLQNGSNVAPLKEDSIVIDDSADGAIMIDDD